MTDWLVIGVYAVGFLPMWRRIFWLMENDMPSDGPMDTAMVLTLACLFTLFWPFLAVGALVWRFFGRDPKRFAKKPKQTKEQRLADLRAEIADLEREVGV